MMRKCLGALAGVGVFSLASAAFAAISDSSHARLGVAQAVGQVRYSAFCGGLDLAADGYSVRGDMAAGRFSFRTPDRASEWVELAVAASVDGRDLGPWSLVGGETRQSAAASYLVVYTNSSSARAELEFLPSKAVFRLSFGAGAIGPVRAVTLGTGSRTDSDYVFDPSFDRQPYHEFPVGVARRIYPGLASPPPWVFSYRKEGRRGCWSAALEPDAAKINFNGVRHGGCAGGRLAGWTVHYPVCRALEGPRFETPPMALRFGDEDFFGALTRHVADLKAEGRMRVPARRLPDWHSRTIACTWRFQRGPVRRDKADEATTEAFVKMLEDAGIDFGTLIIDDFWGAEHGIWEADPKKWRDMRGFVDRQHAKGRRVLLWVCTDGEGLPANERMDAYNWNLDSVAFQARLKAAARRMLSPEPGCYDADGVKFDFTSTAPAAYGDAKDVGCGYLLRRFEMLSAALMAVKPDAILDYQCCNPYFTHTLTMLRLNDYFGAPEHGLDEMRLRARMARICATGALVDTDHIGFGGFSYRGGYDFFRHAHELGVPSLYLRPEDLEDRELLESIRGERR